jgi:hypothetical protein
MKLMKTLNFLKNRRGISAVISNLILIGGVIAVGFSVLLWSQAQSSSYTASYVNAIRSDTDQLRERVAFEYIQYNNNTGNLTVYLMNSGTIGNVSIANVYVNNIAYGAPVLYLLNGTSTNSLNATQEGYFVVSIPSLSSALGNNHPITIITGRGSSFVATFAT